MHSYQNKLDYLESYGYIIFNDDGIDYIIEGDYLIPVDDIEDVVKFVS